MESTIREFAHLQIPLEDVRKATNNFDDSNIIGQGGFGKVYKGQLVWSGKSVKIAARRLERKYRQGVTEFWKEISMLSILNHENIVSVIGFCDENNEKIIINQRCAKGSLLMHIEKQRLTWIQRLRICVGVARALSYLHDDGEHSYSVIHCNVNSSTILLDDNFNPRLSGFEYSVKHLVDQKKLVLLLEAIGTTGYMDPEISKTGGVTIKSDIYSFGIVLWEVLCGRKAFISNEVKHKRSLALLARSHYGKTRLKEIIHTDLWNHMSQKSLTRFSKAAYSCIMNERVLRPDLNYIIQELEEALEFQELFDNSKNKLKQLTTKLSHLKIPLSDIMLATNDFSYEHKIGSGLHFDLYQTTLDHLDKVNSSSVVIKDLLARGEDEVVEEFYMELEMLTTFKHANIVPLVGFCDEGFKMILVTEHAYNNGNLDDYWRNIKDKSVLTWEKRLKICLDVVHALKYIHCEMEDRMLTGHCGIRSQNIVLDENWGAKIMFDQNLLMTTGEFEGNIDVRDLGIVLLEVLFGKSRLYSDFYDETFDCNIETYLPTYINDGQIYLMLDSIIKNDSGARVASLKKFIKIASECVMNPDDQKPTMNVVFNELQQVLLLQEEKQISNNQFPPVETSDFGSPNLMQKEYVDPEDEDDVDEIICGNKLKHLKIPVDEIKDAIINSHPSYVEHYKIHEVELQRFNEDDISSVEGKNDEGEVPKRRKTVCIKQLTSRKKRAAFFTEVEMLTNCKHRNIVTLLGFCVENNSKYLVVEHPPNGFLEEHLKNIKDNPINLTWVKRLKISLDVAKGLKYLHHEMEDQKMVINCCMESSKIGLDENWGAKIFHFGEYSMLLSRNQDGVFNFKRINETPYTDPESTKNGIVTRGTDVYSFGVVLFELLCGRLANDPIYKEGNEYGLANYVARRQIHAVTLTEMIDPIIKEGSGDYKFTLSRGANKNSLETFIKVAYQCLAETVDQRPTMEVVVEELEKALLFQENDEDDPRISLEDITKATQNFDVGNLIGKGGFGNVYRGKLPKGDGFDTIVAKRLDTSGGQGEKQFQNEVQILFNYKHKNVVRLVGYCDEKDEKVIVYEYASRGSLDRYLNNTSLTWMKRVNICIDVATALEFLHGGVATQAPGIHRDIKTENILLNDEWNAKLADYGLSLISSINMKTNYTIVRACGTEGYVDPLYRKSGFLTMESDIYSFGVVLFEILCGRSTFSFHKHEGQFLPSFVKQRFEEGKHNTTMWFLKL